MFSSYLVLSTNLEVGAIALCIWKVRTLSFQLQMGCLGSHGECVGEPGLELCVWPRSLCFLRLYCLADKPKVFWTLNHLLSLPHAAFWCLPPAYGRAHWAPTCEVDAFMQLALVPLVHSVDWLLVRGRQRWQAACVHGDASHLLIIINALHNNYTNYNVISSNWGADARM